MTDYTSLLRIRTITCFVTIQRDSYSIDEDGQLAWNDPVIEQAVDLLRRVESVLMERGYTVQTVRIATNPFGFWLPIEDDSSLSASEAEEVLRALDRWLHDKRIEFCSLGPAHSIRQVEELCPLIVRTSSRFSCSAELDAADVDMARACARSVQKIAYTTEPAEFMTDGLGNFRFAVAACCTPLIPFFPVAKAPEKQQIGLVTFAIGLENGSLAQYLLKKCQTIRNIPTIFRQEMAEAIKPIQDVCQTFETDKITFAGIDTSLNPSLDATGSVAAALESLRELSPTWGGPGTLGVAAALTKSLQSLPEIHRTGYCGIMLPVCEDTRLAELTASNELRLVDLLSISSVCGVGIDTVPLPGDATEEALSALMLDVAGLADRWQKPLSCRVFPLPSKAAGESTAFDFPHMMNAVILPL